MHARSFTTLLLRASCFACLSLGFLAVAAVANTPAANYENLLDTWFDPNSGTLRFADYGVGFAPTGAVDASLAVLDAKGQIVGQHGFFPDYVLQEGVFGVMRIRGPAEVKLSTPGLYTLVMVVNNQPITRLPMKLTSSGASGDPFNPATSVTLDGFWRTRAYFIMRDYKGEPLPDLVLWVGGFDLPAGKSTDQFYVELLRDGKVIAHSKRSLGHIAAGHFKRTQISLFQPHEDRASANAGVFSMAHLSVDGAYEVRVLRSSDQTRIRSFDFDVAGGKIKPMAQTQLGYTPASDYIMPRVQRKNTNTFEMVEAIWIEDFR